MQTYIKAQTKVSIRLRATHLVHVVAAEKISPMFTAGMTVV